MTDSQAMADLSRQIAALQVGMEGIAKNATSAAADAREARDIAIVLKATVDGQNIPERLDGLKEQAAKDKAANEAAITALRSDLVNAISREKTDQKAINDDHDLRIKSLEDDRTERRGAGKLAAWAVKFMPWIGPLMAGALGVFVGEKLKGG